MQQHIINADDSITVSHAITSYGGLLSSHLCYCGTYQQPLTTICWGGGAAIKIIIEMIMVCCSLFKVWDYQTAANWSSSAHMVGSRLASTPRRTRPCEWCW